MLTGLGDYAMIAFNKLLHSPMTEHASNDPLGHRYASSRSCSVTCSKVYYSTQKLILYNCTTAVAHTRDGCERIAATTLHDSVLVAGFFCTAIFVPHGFAFTPPPMLCMKDPGRYDR